MKSSLKFFIILTFLSCSTENDLENDIENQVVYNKTSINVNQNFSVIPNDSLDDSQELQKAMDQSNGAILII